MIDQSHYYNDPQNLLQISKHTTSAASLPTSAFGSHLGRGSTKCNTKVYAVFAVFIENRLQ